MNVNEYQKLLSEVVTLNKLLDLLPRTSAIERMGLEHRKTELELILARAQQPSREPVRARLTFRGKPIVGTHGMFAEFGAAVISAFSEAVAAVGASRSIQLGARGVLPNRDEFRLLITGTATGSFGFELEEAPQDQMLLPPESQIALAIEQTRAIMQATLGDDDELTEAISDADTRALEKLRGFLKILADEDAVCALEFEDEIFKFTDVGQVRRSANRLSNENIHEEDKELTGQFQGVLPKRRTFEFMLCQDQEIISGKVGPDIEDASEINLHLQETLSIRVHTKQVGSGRPRYILLGYGELTA